MLGLLRCDVADWMLFMSLHIICFIFTAIAIYECNKDYKKKLDCGYQFVEGDLKLDLYNVSQFICIGWFGAFISAFCGVGGGFVFVPVLTIIGLEA